MNSLEIRYDVPLLYIISSIEQMIETLERGFESIPQFPQLRNLATLKMLQVEQASGFVCLEYIP